MRKKNNKISNTKGFTLVETLIGLMILTMAIVAATSLLISVIQSNKQIVKTLQAHYLAQEGLEAVRNVRDTNWMNNRVNWKEGFGDEDIPDFGRPNVYVIGLKQGAFRSSEDPWLIALSEEGSEADKVYLCGEVEGNQYFSNECGNDGVLTEFTRHIEISKPEYCSGAEIEQDLENLCNDGKVIFVKSVVEFGETEVSLEEILTDWKGGAL
ncbi:MAG: type II secretion system protein [Candidatus Gracilibacteria bacterium]